MADANPKTVTVEALQPHSYQGVNYDVGDTYDIAEDVADSVVVQGKAMRVDRVQGAKKKAAKPAKKAAKRGKGRK